MSYAKCRMSLRERKMEMAGNGFDLGRQANLKELLESKEFATWGYKY